VLDRTANDVSCDLNSRSRERPSTDHLLKIRTAGDLFPFIQQLQLLMAFLPDIRYRIRPQSQGRRQLFPLRQSLRLDDINDPFHPFDGISRLFPVDRLEESVCLVEEVRIVRDFGGEEGGIGRVEEGGTEITGLNKGHFDTGMLKF
jgi:hypothetical protein